MLAVALIAAWVFVALVLALVIGRAVAVSDKSDRWRHGHRETRDLRRLHPVAPVTPLRSSAETQRPAA